jgi:hypothetical protein
MVRTQIYLTDYERKQLAALAKTAKTSQSELIRQAIDTFLFHDSNTKKIDLIEKIAGLWADHPNPPDPEKLRTGWNRRIPK